MASFPLPRILLDILLGVKRLCVEALVEDRDLGKVVLGHVRSSACLLVITLEPGLDLNKAPARYQDASLHYGQSWCRFNAALQFVRDKREYIKLAFVVCIGLMLD